MFNFGQFLAPDSADQKPAMTRKLRRRPNDPVVPAPQEKRRKPPPVSHIYYLLQDHEIEQDVKAIQEAIASIPSTSTSATTTVKTRDTVNSSSVRKPGQNFNDNIILVITLNCIKCLFLITFQDFFQLQAHQLVI